MHNKSFQVIIDRTVTKDKDITCYGISYNNKKYFIEEVYIINSCHIRVYHATKDELNKFNVFITIAAMNNVKLQDVDNRFIKLITGKGINLFTEFEW